MGPCVEYMIGKKLLDTMVSLGQNDVRHAGVVLVRFFNG